jgi:hypothetical protein
MTLQHAMFPAEMTLTKATIAHDPLRLILAFFEITADAFGCAAAEGESHVDGAFAGYVVG